VDKTKVTDPKAFRFAAGTLAVEPGEDKRRYAGVAYSGKEVTDHPFWSKVIFDLASTASERRVAVLLNHDGDQIVGHTEAVEIAGDIKVAGFLYADEPDGALVAKRSDAGFPWQMSVHIVPGRVEEIRAGETVEVNGEQFAGPGYVFRNARLREISFCPVGADQRTHAVALSAHQQPENRMAQITQEQHDAVVGENAALKGQVAALTKEIAGIKASAEAKAKAERTAVVKKLFAELGTEVSEDEINRYVAMDAETFAAVEKHMRAGKPAAPAYLFSEKAKGSLEGKSPLLATRSGAPRLRRRRRSNHPRETKGATRWLPWTNRPSSATGSSGRAPRRRCSRGRR
jgi:hypothetical protein